MEGVYGVDIMSKPTYKDEHIDKHMPTWRSSGASAYDVIKTICSKYILTDEQADRILKELR